jgi:hypothetical protein
VGIYECGVGWFDNDIRENGVHGDGDTKIDGEGMDGMKMSWRVFGWFYPRVKIIVMGRNSQHVYVYIFQFAKLSPVLEES